MAVLRRYQEEGVSFLASRPHALLAFDMRLGKSGTAISAAHQLGAQRVLVLAPAVARPNWANEFRKWGWPHPAVALTSAKQPTAGYDGAVAMVASYEVATSGPMRHALRSRRWDVLVADECHYLQSKDSLRTQAVYGPEGLARSAERMWSLSGTPAPRHIAQLWPLMRCYGVTPLKYDDFVREYCDAWWNGRELKITGTKASKVQELREMLAPIMLRKRRKDVAPELPGILWAQQVVEARVNLPADFAGAKVDGDVLAWMEEHVEESATLRRVLGMAKAPGVLEQLQLELSSCTGKLLVGAHHTEVVEQLADGLAEFGVVTITGRDDDARKAAAQAAFQTDPAIRVCVANIKAGGVAIDLSAADQVAIVEPSWVPADNVQFAARAQGFDKARPVTATYFSTPNSLDDAITRALVRRSADFEAVFDAVLTT